MNIYGCQTWRYNGSYLDKFSTTWRKAIRRVRKIPYRTNKEDIEEILGDGTDIHHGSSEESNQVLYE